MKLHIFLFRHGETYYNKSKRFTGWQNIDFPAQGGPTKKIMFLDCTSCIWVRDTNFLLPIEINHNPFNLFRLSI